MAEPFSARICFGADIDRGILFRKTGFRAYCKDQHDKSSIRSIWSQPALLSGADIIIEDGLHTFEANVSILGRVT